MTHGKVGEGQQRSRVHPWTSAAVTALAGGGEQRLLHLTQDGIRPLIWWLALHARGPGKGGGGSAALAGTSVDICGGDGAGRGGGSSARFAWLASGSGH